LGHADVFGGKNDHTAGDEFGVFASVDHTGEVVEGGVGVTGAHTFDKGGDGVVVLFAAGVVAEVFTLEGLFEVIDGDATRFNPGIFPSLRSSSIPGFFYFYSVELKCVFEEV